jgi:PST family polysaccharide transporter
VKGGKEKYSHWFEREHLQADLKSHSIKGGISTVGAQLISTVLTLGSTVILARLLLPKDYGLIGMVSAFTGFVLIFKDLGLAQAVVQKQKVTHQEMSKVFWLITLLGLVLGGIIVALAPFLVHFYNEPRLFNIALSFAVIAGLGGLATVHTALLKRQMQFRIIAEVQVMASVFSIILGIIAAFLGFGYWALVIINVSNTFFFIAQVWWRCDWRPSFSRVDKTIIDYVKFGADISGFNMINYLSRNLDNILIGRYLGSSMLGLYDRAYQLLMLPITKLRDPLNSVGIPAMSSLDPNSTRYRDYYKQYVFLLAFFSMPIVVLMAVLAEPLVLFVLGENWIEAAPIFQLLAIVGFIQPVASTRGMVQISSGQSRRFLYWGLFNAILVVAAFLIGINWNIEGLVIAYAISNYIILIPSLFFCFHHTSLRVKDFMIEVSSPAIFSLLAGFGTYVLYIKIQDWALVPLLAAGVALFGGLYILIWFITPRTRERIQKVKHLSKDIFGFMKKKKVKE